ncbi:MAG: hypothetical protein M1833_005374 [Piccolia ochrophora]|nr:MAG: hypothetical protein M1833_005374 [Piccolia ochrophora]
MASPESVNDSSATLNEKSTSKAAAATEVSEERSIMEQLRLCLEQIHTYRNFATFGWCDFPPIPVIKIDNIGGIGLPLFARDAKLISTQWPPPSTDERTVSIDPANFGLQNPAWPSFVSKLVDQIKTALDITSSALSVKLESLILTEHGNNLDRRMTYALEDGSQQPAATLSTTIAEAKEQLRRTLSLWDKYLDLDSHQAPPYLAYVFDNEYQLSGYTPDSLKGIDRTRFDCLSHAAKEPKFCLYLGKFEFLAASVDTSTSPLSVESNSLKDMLLSTNTITSPEGVIFKGKLSIDKKVIIQETVSQRYLGCTDAKLMILIIPQDFRIQFLLEHFNCDEEEIKSWLERLNDVVRARPEHSRAQTELSHFCNLIMARHRLHTGEDTSTASQHVQGKTISDELLGLVAKGGLLIGECHFLEDAASGVAKRLPMSLFAEIGKALHHLEFANLEETLKRTISPSFSFSERMQAVEDVLESYETHGTTTSKVEITEETASSDEKSPSDETKPAQTTKLHHLDRWETTVLEDALNGSVELYKEDGQQLVSLIERHGNKFLFKSIMPLVKSKAKRSEVVVGFTTSLIQAAKDERIGKKTMVCVFKDIVSDVSQQLFEEEPTPPTKKQQLDPTSNLATGQSVRKVTFEGSNLAILLEQCLSEGFSAEKQQLLDNVQKAVPDLLVSDLENSFLPFLKDLTGLIQRHSALALHDPSYQAFYRAVLGACKDKIVERKPSPPSDLTRRAVGCGMGSICEDCVSLDRFLASSSKKIERFPVKASRRKHVRSRFTDGARENLRYSFQTTARGSPRTLIVTKLDGLEIDRERWRKSALRFHPQIIAMGREPLKRLLGDKFDEITGEPDCLRSYQRKASP